MAKAKAPKHDVEATGAQRVDSLAFSGLNPTSRSAPATYATYRAIRKHPTIALARALSIAPIVAGNWSVEADEDVPDEAVELISRDLMPIREPLVQAAMENGCDYGWSPWEKVYTERDGRIRLRRLKSLLVDKTTILIEETGAFAGFRQTDALGGDVDVPLENCLLVNFRVEGDYHYGEPLLENVRPLYEQWCASNVGAARYDEKIAGSHWVVYYPPGSSKYNGTVTDNAAVAKAILQSLESSGAVTLPTTIAAEISRLNAGASELLRWRIELLGDTTPRQPTFNERAAYLDKLLVRGLLVPERAILEGQFGTRADAGSHADLALTAMELAHRHVTRLVNWHLVDQLLALNFGESARGTVRLVEAPLADEALAFLRELYKSILAGAAGVDELVTLDTDALKDRLGVPKVATVAGMNDGEVPEGVEYAGAVAERIRKLYADAAGSAA